MNGISWSWGVHKTTHLQGSHKWEWEHPHLVRKCCRQKLLQRWHFLPYTQLCNQICLKDHLPRDLKVHKYTFKGQRDRDWGCPTSLLAYRPRPIFKEKKNKGDINLKPELLLADFVWHQVFSTFYCGETDRQGHRFNYSTSREFESLNRWQVDCCVQKSPYKKEGTCLPTLPQELLAPLTKQLHFSETRKKSGWQSIIL